MKPSILRNLGIAFFSFGLLMGVIFPFYAQFFVEWKPGMQRWFVIGCLLAGSIIGIVNYWLVNVVLLRKLRRISTVANAISNKDITFQCQIESHDVIGEIVNSFNRMALTLREMISSPQSLCCHPEFCRADSGAASRDSKCRQRLWRYDPHSSGDHGACPGCCRCRR